MNKVLSKRLLRDLRSNAGRYAALILLIAMGIFLVTGIVGSSETVMIGTDRRTQTNMTEDGQFTVFLPLTDEEIAEVSRGGTEIERMFSLDLTVKQGQKVRMFKNREHIDLIQLDSGRLAQGSGEAVIEKRFSEVNGYGIGDTLTAGGYSFTVTGIGTVPDYDNMLADLSDTAIDSTAFGLIFVTSDQYDDILESGTQKAEDYTYAYRLGEGISDDDIKDRIKSLEFDASKVEDKYFRESIDEILGVRKKIEDSVDDLCDATAELDDGAKELYDGTEELYDGTGDLSDGVTELGDGTKQLKDGTKQMKDGTADLSDGAKELSDGAGKLKDGTAELKNGTSELRNGADELKNGTVGLRNGTKDMKDGTKVLSDGAAGLESGAAEVHSGAVSIDEGAGKVSKGADELSQGLSKLDLSGAQLDAGADKLIDAYLASVSSSLSVYGKDITLTRENYAQVLSQMAAATGQTQLTEMKESIDSLMQFRGSLTEYTGGVSNAASGASSLADGARELKNGTAELKDGTNSLSAGAKALHSGATALDDGAEKLDEGARELDVGAQELADGAKELDDGARELDDGVQALDDGVKKLDDGARQIEDGAKKLDDGVNELDSGTKELEDGTRDLRDGAKELKDGSKELSDGTGEFRDKADDLREDMDELLDKVFEIDIENLTSFIKRDDNIRIAAASGDVILDRTAGLAAGVILLMLMAYVISVFVTHQIERESSVIGALYALGAKKKDLLRHYITLPTVIAFTGGAVGFALSFAPFGVAAQMKDTYNYFSIPKFDIVYPVYLVVYDLILPPLIAALVNTLVINSKLSRTALSLMRNEQTGTIRQFSVKTRSFKTMFAIRQLVREARSAVTVLLGMFFSLMIVCLGLNTYTLCTNVSVRNSAETKYEYMYLYKYPTDEAPSGGEKAYVKSLSTYDTGYNLPVTVIGLDGESRFFDAHPEKSISKAVINNSIHERLGYKAGDKVTFTDEAAERSYTFLVTDICEYSPGFTIFMDREKMCELFDEEEDYYNAVYSDKALDIEEGRLYSITAKDDIERASGVFIDNLQSLIWTLLIAGTVIFCVVMYLMMGVMIDRSAFGISLIKIFGFRSREIRSLYLNGNLLIVAVGGIICIPLAKAVMDMIYPSFIANVACCMDITYPPQLLLGIYAAMMLIYLVINELLVFRVKNITPAEVLKNRE